MIFDGRRRDKKRDGGPRAQEVSALSRARGTVFSVYSGTAPCGVRRARGRGPAALLKTFNVEDRLKSALVRRLSPESEPDAVTAGDEERVTRMHPTRLTRETPGIINKLASYNAV